MSEIFPSPTNRVTNEGARSAISGRSLLGYVPAGFPDEPTSDRFARAIFGVPKEEADAEEAKRLKRASRKG